MILLELMYTYHFHWRPSDDNALAYLIRFHRGGFTCLVLECENARSRKKYTHGQNP